MEQKKGRACFDRDFCLNNLTVEEMKHMMSSFFKMKEVP